MNSISINLPEYIIQKINDISIKEKIPVDQFITLALDEKLSAFMTEDYLIERGNSGAKEKYLEALSKVPDFEVEEYDKL
jgi:hypothetical protein